MKISAFSIVFFLALSSFAQSTGTVIDAKTGKPIPYVNIWVKNETIGTTSTTKGEFSLPKTNKNSTLVFSAIGYENKEIKVDNLSEMLQLEPQVTSLQEVFIYKKKGTEEQTVGKFRKSKINFFYGCGTPWIIARFFPYKKEYAKTPLLKTIALLTDNRHVKRAKFNIRLYAVGKDGKPSGYIYYKNIIGIAKKRRRKIKIDLYKLNIHFPENGFFVAVEWLITDENKYESDSGLSRFKKKIYNTEYEPNFGTVPFETNKNGWIYRNGKWHKPGKNKRYPSTSVTRYTGKYPILAVELELTN